MISSITIVLSAVMMCTSYTFALKGLFKSLRDQGSLNENSMESLKSRSFLMLGAVSSIAMSIILLSISKHLHYLGL